MHLDGIQVAVSRLAGGAALTIVVLRPLPAQHSHGAVCDRARSCVGATATALFSHVAADGGRTLREGYLTQPFIAASATAWRGRLHALGAYNFEGYTLRRGELSPGIWGEGYIDRRHPHTYLHELMVGARATLGAAALSLYAGKGFVPFGSEDPMMRPFTRYPANHHLAQILERAQIVAAARAGAVAVEVATFGGDEPSRAADWPNSERLFDSRAARATFFAARGFEFSASLADVKSPEDPAGFGLNQNKRALSLRYSGTANRGARYALVEWARTTEWLGPRKDLWSFATVLAEASARTALGDVAVRLERTSRPEEQRDRTRFRSVRPLLDFGILGRTRWENVTIGWSRSESAVPKRVQVTPFIEVSFNRARPIENVVIESPAQTFGGLRLFSISAGVRAGIGRMRSTMGRYGAAA